MKNILINQKRFEIHESLPRLENIVLQVNRIVYSPAEISFYSVSTKDWQHIKNTQWMNKNIVAVWKLKSLLQP